MATYPKYALFLDAPMYKIKAKTLFVQPFCKSAAEQFGFLLFIVLPV